MFSSKGLRHPSLQTGTSEDAIVDRLSDDLYMFSRCLGLEELHKEISFPIMNRLA